MTKSQQDVESSISFYVGSSTLMICFLIVACACFTIGAIQAKNNDSPCNDSRVETATYK